MNNIFENIDIENVSTSVMWNTEKAKCILSDVHDYFICRDLKHPDAETLDNIRFGFATIFTKLSVVADILDSINSAVKPIEDAVEAKYKRF